MLALNRPAYEEVNTNITHAIQAYLEANPVTPNHCITRPSVKIKYAQEAKHANKVLYAVMQNIKEGQ